MLRLTSSTTTLLPADAYDTVDNLLQIIADIIVRQMKGVESTPDAEPVNQLDQRTSHHADPTAGPRARTKSAARQRA